jgi:site-specific DNA-methyltransferase (adenine-specific)
MNFLNQILHGDCLELCKSIPDASIDLIFTSPPYADRRKIAYGGLPADKYVDWFSPIATEFKRILKPTGSFFLNIKPHTEDGERVLYVFDLILSLKRNTGFYFVDEFSWVKLAFPGGLKGRFKNGFEPIYHFTVSNPNQITFNPVACGTPVKEASISRTYRKQTGAPESGSGMAGLDAINIRNLSLARPSNVLSINNISNQFSDKSKHPATFPIKLADFFIKSFTNPGDVVLDPFVGSGTTAISAANLGRKYIGFDLKEEYVELSKGRILKEANPHT